MTQETIDLIWGIVVLTFGIVFAVLVLWFVYEEAYQLHVETQAEKHRSVFLYTNDD